MGVTIQSAKGGLGGSTGSDDNRLLRSDGTGGATAQASAITVDDDGDITSFGGQLGFPASQNASTGANVLDDYEEGTYTPTITASSGSFTTVSATGNYRKAGQIVFVWGRITITTVGTASGLLYMTTPFTTQTAPAGGGVAVRGDSVMGACVSYNTTQFTIASTTGGTMISGSGIIVDVVASIAAAS